MSESQKITFNNATVTIACDANVDTIDIGVGSPFKAQEVRESVTGDSSQADVRYKNDISPRTFYVQSDGAQSFNAKANVTITGGAPGKFVVRATDLVGNTGAWTLQGA